VIPRWDRHAEAWIVAHRVGVLDPVFRWLTYAGVGGAVWLALAVVVVAAVARRPKPFVLVALVDGAAQLLVPGVQQLVGRARPHVPTLVAEPHGHSFPSGHATSSFACAVVLYSFTPRLRAWLLLLAAAIAFSRLYVGVHYPLDVLAGSALGSALGWAVLAFASAAPRDLRRLGASRRRSRPARRAG
jgi:undecaprenyl-diphosphatase